MILMIIDHVGEYLLADNPWCRALGRGAAPLFFFLIGHVNKLRMHFSLILYGCILSLWGFLTTSHFWINILITFIFIQYLLWIFPPERINPYWRLFLCILIIIGNPFIYPYVEYGSLGLLFAYSARLLAIQDPQSHLFLLLTLFSYFIWECVYFHFYDSWAVLGLFGIVLLSLYFTMRFYTFRVISTTKLSLPMLLLSRYSLEVYFFHLVILNLIYFFFF